MKSLIVRRKVVEAAVMLMERAGIVVERSDHEGGAILTVALPPDSSDPHGDRLRAHLEHVKRPSL